MTPQLPQPALPLAGCSYGWLFETSLDDALRSLAAHGFHTIELTTAPPHLYSPRLGAFERQQLVRTLRELQLQVISINPSFCDLNLLSTNPDFQQLSERQMVAELQLASELEADFVVLIPGRRHALAPAPDDDCRALLHDSLTRLLCVAEQLGVTLCLENNPYGYLGSAAELFAIVDAFDSPHLGLTYDVANTPRGHDPVEELRHIRSRLRLAHISDTWGDRWAHTAIGRGEVDFAAFASGLREIGFAGTTVYELIDRELPDSHLAGDIDNLRAYGWSPDRVADHEEVGLR